MAGAMNKQNARQHNKDKKYYESQRFKTEENLKRKGKTNKKEKKN